VIHFYRAVARVAIRSVLERTPRLCIRGFGDGRPARKQDGKLEDAREHFARFLGNRQELLEDAAVDQFLRSLAFLRRVQATKTVRPDTSSYRLKHIAENYACTYPEGDKLGPHYVSNGALIAAAIHAGFRYKTYVDELGWDSPNVNFNMSKPRLDDLDCEIRPDGARAEQRRRRVEQGNANHLRH
jgi:hypothetical protein